MIRYFLGLLTGFGAGALTLTLYWMRDVTRLTPREWEVVEEYRRGRRGN